MADTSWSGFSGSLGTDITSANAKKWASYSSNNWDYTHWLIIEDTSYPYLGTQENDFSGMSGSTGTDITSTNAKLEASYTDNGWNFSTIWSIYETYTYPWIYNPPCSITDDFVYKKYLNQGIRITWLNSDTNTYEIYKNTNLDLGSYDDGENTNSNRDYIGMSFYVSDKTMFQSTTYCTVKLESSIGNYISYVIDSSNHTIINGWNSNLFLKNDVTRTGNVDWASITKIYLEFPIASGNINEYITMGVMALMKNYTTPLPQDIDTTDSPTFADVTLTGLTADKVVYGDSSKKLTSSTVSYTSLNHIADLDQSVATASTPIFEGAIISSLTADRVIYADTNKQLTSTTVSPTDLANISGLDQTVDTTSDVKFKEIEIEQTATNTQSRLTLTNNQALARSASAAGYITMNSNVFAGNTIGVFDFKNRGTTKASIEINDDSYFTFKTAGTERFKVHWRGYVSVNGATGDAVSQGSIAIKKGTGEPTTSTVDQITMFATTDTSTTIGFRTEATTVAATPTADYILPIKINGTTYNLLLQEA